MAFADRSIVLVWLLTALSVAADTAPVGFTALQGEAGAAYEAGNFPLMRQRLEAALLLRPAHPPSLYNLACAQARNGDGDAALATLSGLVSRGLYFDLGKERDLDAVTGRPEFKRLLQAMDRNRSPAGRAHQVFTVADPDFIPEGIAYDADTGSYFLGSVHGRRIVRVRNGVARTLAGSATGGLLAPLGMVADSRRRLLWVAHAGLDQMRGMTEAERGQTGVLAFEIDTGVVKKRAPFPKDGQPHILGDITLGADGDLFVSDSPGGRVYRLDTTRGSYTPLTAIGALVSPQGLVQSQDRRTLYVADYAQGLFALDLHSGALERLSAGADMNVYGTDGMARQGDDLIAIQNGYLPHRVVRLRVDGSRIAGLDVLAAALPAFEEPTQGVMVGSGFTFVANSQWGRFNKEHQLPDSSELKNPVALRVLLSGE